MLYGNKVNIMLILCYKDVKVKIEKEIEKLVFIIVIIVIMRDYNVNDFLNLRREVF